MTLPPALVDEVLARLHQSVADQDYVLIGAGGFGYESLFNTFRVGDNPAWR